MASRCALSALEGLNPRPQVFSIDLAVGLVCASTCNPMGVGQSKEELLYQQVSYGNIEGIRMLRSQGAGLEVIA